MNLKLTGDTAVVIGGASGIGRAIAQQFVNEGAKVVILDLAEPIDPVESATFYRCDIRRFVQLARLSAKVDECDHLVVAAGAGSGKFGFPFWNLKPADWREVIEVNLMGVVNAAHAFQAGMVKRKSGTMLFLSSIAAQIGSQTDPPYSAAKAAVINFAQCAAKDLAPHNVRVNVIAPGMVKTPLNESVWKAWNDQQSPEDQRSYEDWAEEKINKITPLRRWQSPEDIAAMTVFLASPLAKNITGQTINVDGGIVMR